MREIKFRAWQKYHKRMSEVFQIDFVNKRIFITANNAGKPAGYLYFDDCELMQYTGLKDKNSVEIYEGDTCNCMDANGDYYLTEVYYDGGALSVNTSHGEYDYIAIGWALSQGDIEEIEVIGNIYKNPELLKTEG